MRVLVYDPDYHGHHMKYASLIVQTLYDAGHQVVYAAPRRTFESDEYLALLAGQESQFGRVALPFGRYRWKSTEAWGHSWWLLRTICGERPDVVLVPHLDLCFYVFGLAGLAVKHLLPKWPRICGIQFAAVWAYDEANLNLAKKLKKRIAAHVVNSGLFSRILFIDEYAFEWFVKTKSRGQTEISVCPDPVEPDIETSMEDCRECFGIPRRARVIGCAGAIDERKGIDVLLMALAHSSMGSNSYLLLVGKQSPRVRQLLQIAKKDDLYLSERIVERDSFVTTNELQKAVKAMDVVCMLYPCHYASASILLRAAAARRPVLGSDTGWVGRVVTKYQLGRICNVNDQKDLLRGLEWAFNNPTIDAALAERLAAFNSIDSFERKIDWLISDKIE